MSRLLPSLAVLLLLVVPAAAKDAPLPVGGVEKTCTLDAKNTQIRGLAIDDVSSGSSRLLVLDASAKVFCYQLPREGQDTAGRLKLLETIELPADARDRRPAKPRGLAYAREDGHDVLYYMNWDDSPEVRDDEHRALSQLWRFDVDDDSTRVADLSRYTLRIGDRETFDLTRDGDELLVSFNPTEYADQNVRVQRGIVRLRWDSPYDADPQFVRHLPDSGVAPSHGLACMTLEGARYLWATAGNRAIYCADGPTGRGLFCFDRPASSRFGGACWGLCFGRGALWVSENAGDSARVHRVNVTENLDSPATGPRALRHLVMTIETESPHWWLSEAGKVCHNYSRPYANRQMPNQDILPKTERIVDLSKATNASIHPFTYDPAGDKASRQYMQSVVYADASPARYQSRYEIDLWTRPYRTFVYPHRVDKNASALAGTNYLEDDPELYNLTSDRKTYEAFIRRIKAHIHKKYGVPADMDNPYWAARNTVEYIQDNYYYPNRAKRRPATVDYDRKHYDANPGNMKIALSDRPYDKTQIIACSGTSVMVAGTMRHLGIPARWLGTGTPYGPDKWDTNDNGLLDRGETALCTNGHRYNHVWLGTHYGWTCFDATPSKPDQNDYDQPPPLQSQWRYMERCAAGTRKADRIVFNVGSRLFRPLYHDFEYDERLAVINACGGDQRYNLQARFDKPELWRNSSDRIAVTNLCFLDDVKLQGPPEKTKVTWNPQGSWRLDPSATVSVTLQRLVQRTGRWRPVAMLAKAVPYLQKSAVVDLSDYWGGQYRIVIRKDGDPATGGQSAPFDL